MSKRTNKLQHSSLTPKMASIEGPTNTISFKDLPVEIVQLIGVYIEDDRDLIAFRSTCRATNNAVMEASLWRRRFLRTYDFQGFYTNDQWRRMYQGRAKMLHTGLKYNFSQIVTNYETRVLLMLRRLINESFVGATELDRQGRLISRNQAHLIEFVRNGRMFNNFSSSTGATRNATGKEKEVISAVKLMCFHFILQSPEMSHRFERFDESQYAVYESRAQAPLFTGGFTKVNFEWLLHNMNFFRHHMMVEKLFTLYNRFGALPLEQRPSAWRVTPGTAPRTLTKYWRGTFAYIHDHQIARLQAEGAGRRPYADYHIEEGKMQTIKFEFAEQGRLPSGRELRWPAEYERKVNSLYSLEGNTQTFHAQPKRSRFPDPTPFVVLDSVDADNRMFQSRGVDNGNPFWARGWVTPLPPQGDIPGWSRFTMVKEYQPGLNHAMDDLWAYEGVVLPGNRVIMGRWWFASHNSRPYVGPFILWAVERAENEPDSEPESDEDSESEPDEESESEPDEESESEPDEESESEPDEESESEPDEGGESESESQ